MLISKNNFEKINNERLEVINVNGYTFKRLFSFVDKILYIWRLFLSKIRILEKSKSKKYTWKKVYISFNDAHNSYRTKIYEVYITVDNPRFEYVVKPSKKIYSFEFENLFGFGPKCKGYSENRLIGLFKTRKYKVN